MPALGVPSRGEIEGLIDARAPQLTAVFLQGSSAPQASWTLIGVGIRMAQDVGAHRKKVYNAKPTVEEELWKRAFWSVRIVQCVTTTTEGVFSP